MTNVDNGSYGNVPYSIWEHNGRYYGSSSQSKNNEPYSDKEYRSRAISFKGCFCELEKIAESYKIYEGIHPPQYNWNTLEVDKKTGAKKLGYLLPETYLKWTNWKKK
ncbi:hypothetical protein [Mesobacillus foraminis]|uniref:hypothetical protein n=1 Tax=Mesobacillus foraminis TaxID=279826 RepID=UPI0013CF2DAF|nr:hypothetical protein [Mesobacillus foraminis]